MRRLTSMIGPDWAYGVKNAFIATGLLAMASACGGGGCSSSCAGSSVIPGGFPKAERVTNGAGVRLTKPGLEFLSKNLGAIVNKVIGSSASGGVMTFPVNESSGKVLSIFDYTVCPGGPKPGETPPKCIVEINLKDIKNVTIDSVNPNQLNIKATIPIRLRNLPVKAIGINTTAGLTKGSASTCDTGEYVDLPATAEIALEAVPDDATHAARAGYTRINIKKLDFTQSVLEDNFKFCGSGIGTSILNAIKGLIIGSVIGGLTGNLTKPLADATCMKSQKLPDGTEQCPKDTFNVSGTCRYANKADAECVPMLLGLESRFDLSGLLASLSPGTSGGLDFMLASAGDMKPAPGTGAAENGVTLSMFGGGVPQPISNCVPQAVLTPPVGIQLPDELSANTVTGWTGATPPHLGIGLAERFLNHAAGAAYNSGLFCIGVSSEQISQLNAGLFSLLLSSINGLSDKFKAGDSAPAMGLAIRPQKAPVITIGDNVADFSSPLIDLKLKDTDLDFYMWSHDRFIRLFTGRIDIGVPINMEAGKEGIGLKFPPKNPLSFTNPRISNNNLLLEKDAQVGKLVESIGGLIPASTFSSIKPFKLDSALSSVGLTLDIPAGGIRKLQKGEDRFIGIFATLGVAAAGVPQNTTSARVVSSKIVPSNFDLDTVGSAPPVFQVHAEAVEDDGTRAVEYAYQVDNGPYSMFAPGRDFAVTSPFFILQGKHVIRVTSRVVGNVHTEGEAFELPVIVDVRAPVVKVENDQPGLVRVVAADLVSKPTDLKVEARIDGGAWVPVLLVDNGAGKLARFVSVKPEMAQIDIRATDEAGNVASTSAPLIRGRADAAAGASSGCGCSVPGKEGSDLGKSGGLLAALGLVGAVLERRRRRTRAKELAAASLMVLAGGASGCSCAGGENTGDNPLPPDNNPELRTYVIGSYTSAAVATDGTIWVAGYHEGDPSTGSTDDFYGDLAVGKYDTAKQAVDWKVVDGVPDVPLANRKKKSTGFRDGITDQGDDVGLYTSMVLDAGQNPWVAYHDRTNNALRVAHYDGNKWSTHEVDKVTNGWAGRYTSMALIGGKVAIAYQTIEPGTGGAGKNKVRLAKASSDAPSSTTDWAIEDVAVEDKYPCVDEVCTGGSKCFLGDKTGVGATCQATTSGCAPACGDGEGCVKAASGTTSCLKLKPKLAQYHNGTGLFVSMAAAGSDVAIVFYDRFKGNIRAASNKGGKWTVTPANAPLDGWTGDAKSDAGKGDRGIGATLAIDASGNWHVAYVDGLKEGLMYKFVPGGDLSKAAPAVSVDDGTTADGSVGTKFTDGQHLVGENAHLVVAGADVKLVYQDSTAGTLHWAKGAGGATAKFTRGIVKQDGTAGFFPRIVGNQVVNFFRMKGTTLNDDGTPSSDAVILGNVRVLPLP